ncbi:metacaspase 6, partial [Trifolium medium]|nr:metacaspase 6 [Trifolium medium]
MKVKLMELRGFTEDNITLMIDQDEEEPIRKSLQPTDFNIRRTLLSLLHSARRGDILYIHLIAYGCSDG